jgi:hypothetical protein
VLCKYKKIYINIPKDESIRKTLRKERLEYTEIFLKINQIFQISRLGVKEEGVRKFYNEGAS